MDVLTLYGKGRTTEGIAAVLHIAPKTVETHVLHIRAVLGLEHLYEVIAYGARYIQQRTEEA
jgi:DNA-binding CsgD family transcriptional regulator